MKQNLLNILITYFFLSICISISINAQIFSIHSTIQEKPPISQEEEELLQKIYQNLLATLHLSSRTLPKVKLTTRKDIIASYSKPLGLIEFEIDAFRICKEFGEFAETLMTYILGHELTHFIQKHHWQQSDFTTAFFVYGISMDDEKKRHEWEADKYGLFLTYLAGHEFEILKNKVPELIDTLYNRYVDPLKNNDIIDVIKERKKIVEDVKPFIEKMIMLYEAANLLYASGNAYEAFLCNDALSQLVHLSEVYNNKGVTAFQSAYDNRIIASKNEPNPPIWFQYPIAINLDFSLEQLRTIMPEELLDEAIIAFKTAQELDPQNPHIDLNLACLYNLKGKHLIVENTLKSYLSINDKSLKARFKILEGINAAHQKEIKKADKAFNQAHRLTLDDDPIKYLIKQNQQFLSREMVYTNSMSKPVLEDQIANLRIDKWRNFKQQHDFHILDMPSDDLYIQYIDSSIRLAFLGEHSIIRIHYTKSPSYNTNRGIKIHSTYQQIQKAYQGFTHNVLLHQRGYYIIIPEKGLIFNLNSANQVEYWGIYHKSLF